MKDNIKYLIMDVDGTLTDGKIYMGNNGELFKVFDIKDGCGIRDIAIPSGIIPIVMTGRNSSITEKRCKELGIINLYQGVTDKIVKLDHILPDVDFQTVAYIGDDINDVSCMKYIKYSGGIIGCPADASRSVIDIADFISDKNGGEGAVREFIEWIVG